jgi:hypothetical protein
MIYEKTAPTFCPHFLPFRDENPTRAASMLIQMDQTQQNHLKAYGIAFWMLQQEVELHWLLNYKGGSFMVKHIKQIENECIIRGVSYTMIADAQANAIFEEIASTGGQYGRGEA